MDIFQHEKELFELAKNSNKSKRPSIELMVKDIAEMTWNLERDVKLLAKAREDLQEECLLQNNHEWNDFGTECVVCDEENHSTLESQFEDAVDREIDEGIMRRHGDIA